MSMTGVKRFVLGFAFSDDLTEVVLIRKTRPPFQAGLWNGIGGKMELRESPIMTMDRETCEELMLPDNAECDLGWIYAGVIRGINYDQDPFFCPIFFARMTKEARHEVRKGIYKIRQMREHEGRSSQIEVPEAIPLDSLYSNWLYKNHRCMTNLPMLIPYGRAFLNSWARYDQERRARFEIIYHPDDQWTHKGE